MDNEGDSFSFCLTSFYNEGRIYKKEKLLPLFSQGSATNLLDGRPWLSGAREDRVLLSLSGERPGMLSILLFEGQSHLTENSLILNLQGALIELHWYNNLLNLQQNTIHCICS